MIKLAKPLLALAPFALLAACSGDEPAPPPPADNATEMLDVTNEAANVQEAPAVANVPATLNTAAEEELPPVPDREQIQADADATGMTARVNREGDEDTAPAATNGTSSVSEEK